MLGDVLLETAETPSDQPVADSIKKLIDDDVTKYVAESWFTYFVHTIKKRPFTTVFMPHWIRTCRKGRIRIRLKPIFTKP